MHFSVIVFDADNLDEILEPFSENLDVEPYIRPVSDWTLDRGRQLAAKAGPKSRNYSLERICKALNDEWDEGYFIEDGQICETTSWNPNAHWDWWVLGGRWRGFFPLKEGVDFDPEWHLGDPGTHEKMQMREGKGPYEDYAAARKVDRVYLKNIDFDKERDRLEKIVRKDFSKWRECFTGHERPRSWADLLASLGNSRDARDVYNGQKVIKAWNSLQENLFWGVNCPVDHYGFDEKAAVEAAREAALVPYAVVHDGQWIEKSDGSFSSGNLVESNRAWSKQVHEIFQQADPETVVALVDCHS